MRFWIGLLAFTISIPAVPDSLTRSQWDAILDGVRKSTKSLLYACTDSSDFVLCAQSNGIRCENVREKAAEDYRCATRTTTEFAHDKSSGPSISEILEVNYRVYYDGEVWSIGPESIGRVVNWVMTALGRVRRYLAARIT